MVLMATKITIADLFPDDEGMILVAKGIVDGSPRHISQVTNGAACGCVCFGCGRRLIARNGGNRVVRAHSFAHRPEDMVVDCTSSGETALHIRAKEIIARHCRVTLPETSVLDLDGKRLVVSPVRSIDLTDVHLETAEGEVIPDVVATMPNGRRLFIEIANTHPCPPEKIEKLDAMGVDVLEISVRKYQNHPLDELDDIILDIAARKLIHSAEEKAMAAKIAERKRQQEEKERADAERYVAIYRDNRVRNHKKAAELAAEMLLWGFADLMDLDDELPSAFIVPRRQWQAAVFYRLIDTEYPGTVSPIDMINRFRDRGWEKPELLFMKTELSRKIATAYAEDFKSAYEEVLAYMKRLEKADIVYQKPGKLFYMTHDFKAKLNATLERLELADTNREALQVAYSKVEAFMTPADGAFQDFDMWLRGRAAQQGLEPDEFLSDDDGFVQDLEDQLEVIRQLIVDMQALQWVELPEELVGLPLDDLFRRLMRAWIEAEENAGDGWRSRMESG